MSRNRTKRTTKVKQTTKAAPARKRGGEGRGKHRPLPSAKDSKWNRALKKKRTGDIVVELPEVKFEVESPKTKGKKTKTTSTKAGPDEARYAEAFESWKNGAQISTLVKETGFPRPRLRRELIVRAGGVAGFKALRAQGAGGKAEPFGGKRASGGTRRKTADGIVVPNADDKNVPIIESMRRSDGWSVRRLWAPKLVTLRLPDGNRQLEAREQVGIVHIAPDGAEYVECRTPNEKADLRRESPINPGTYLRFRLFESSPVAKKLAQTEKLVEQGNEAHEARKQKKREAREAKKSADVLCTVCHQPRVAVMHSKLTPKKLGGHMFVAPKKTTKTARRK